MLSLSQNAPLQALIERQNTQRATRRLAHAVAQALQLRVEDTSVVLAPLLSQPITLGNREALQQWVAAMLIELDLPADSKALEPLCQRLNRVLSEVH